PTNCNAHLAESIFQTRSRAASDHKKRRHRKHDVLL
ncbi:DUF6783 domain-containing protein, partial [Anaerobutyricum hallii]